MQRWDEGIQRRRPFHERYENVKTDATDEQSDESEPIGFESDGGSDSGEEGEEGWRSPSGERLRDYGVDEDAEFYDEDNVPLAELIRRRKAASE